MFAADVNSNFAISADLNGKLVTVANINNKTNKCKIITNQ